MVACTVYNIISITKSLYSMTFLNFFQICQKNNGSCHIYINGYFVTVPIFIVLGIIWYKVFKNILLKFESLGLSHWKVDDKQLNTEEEMEPCVTPHSL